MINFKNENRLVSTPIVSIKGKKKTKIKRKKEKRMSSCKSPIYLAL